MNNLLRFVLVLILFLTNKTYAQTAETIEKSSFIISSLNENITSTQLNVYKTAVYNYTNLDELRFLDQRRTILFEKNEISIELLSANELLEKYGKEIPVNTIVNGSKYLPVQFQLINWENGYSIYPIFDKFNELTY